jgi:integrase
VADRHHLNDRRTTIMKLDRTTVASLTLPPGKSELFVWDDDLPGFGVRLRGNTTRYVVQYRVHGQQRRESLGDIRKVLLEAARRIARQRFASAELGTDPAAERVKGRTEAKAKTLTFEVVAARYLATKKGMVREATYLQIEHHLTKLWAPFSKKPITTITRADVASRLHEIVAEAATDARAQRVPQAQRGKITASRARGNLSTMFTWAMKEGLIEANPTIVTNDPASGIASRNRVLADAELAAIWHACANDDFGRIVKLLILTGCRRDEIGGLRRSELNLDTGVMAIDGARTKNHRPLVLTLPPPAVDILRAVPLKAGRDYVFGYRGAAFSSWSYSMMALNNRMSAQGAHLPHWTLHDLRRTTRSGLGRLGVPPHIAERVINHAPGGVEAVYDLYTYQAEMKAALALWADHVASIVL